MPSKADVLSSRNTVIGRLPLAHATVASGQEMEIHRARRTDHVKQIGDRTQVLCIQRQIDNALGDFHMELNKYGTAGCNTNVSWPDQIIYMLTGTSLH